MKTKQLIIATALASACIAPSAFAQSVFQGFYGQIGIGYESSAPSFSGGTVTGTPYTYSVSSSNLNYFTGTVAAGYYFPITNAFVSTFHIFMSTIGICSLWILLCSPPWIHEVIWNDNLARS